MRRRTAVLWLIVMLLLTNTVTWGMATGRIPWARSYLSPYLTSAPADLDTPEWRQFFDVLKRLQQEYVDPEAVSDPGKLIEGATRGLVEAVGDPYSYYLDARLFEEMRIEGAGLYAGVGMQIEAKDGHVVVVAPFDGTPADKAGLREGDRIVKVDGQDVVGRKVDEVATMIRGKPGTKVTLTIRRAGVEDFDVTIERAVIEIPTVSHKVFRTEAGPVAYIRLMMFNEKTMAQFRAAWQAAQQAQPKGLLLDLRSNPGGYLDVSIEFADLLLPAGPIVQVVERGAAPKVYRASGGGLGIPLVVLVNENSASASEIVAGAIKDREAGLLVGTRTFGKASVQRVWELNYLEQPTAVRITTAQYLTPNGHTIHGQGIEPHVVVENEKAGPDEGRVRLDDPDDPRNVQLRKALELLAERIRGG